ncbi:hypothetical protein RRG08_039828 [Elysia crispata]|uniref:Uncharacterized protein n=1 Tax=Elysia crispata TaxID=231223 RepID=A0AAE0XNZ1_9GAST|nr:hypothetical protein RRG08_039828 [Elysia crispata]
MEAHCPLDEGGEAPSPPPRRPCPPRILPSETTNSNPEEVVELPKELRSKRFGSSTPKQSEGINPPDEILQRNEGVVLSPLGGKRTPRELTAPMN